MRDHVHGLPACAAVNCDDDAPAVAAFAALEASGGGGDACGDHFAVLQAYHDSCEGIERRVAAVRDWRRTLWKASSFLPCRPSHTSAALLSAANSCWIP